MPLEVIRVRMGPPVVDVGVEGDDAAGGQGVQVQAVEYHLRYIGQVRSGSGHGRFCHQAQQVRGINLYALIGTIIHPHMQVS